MRLLLCSDLHRDAEAARSLVARAAEADALVCAGDLATKREGLQEMADILCAAEVPVVVVPGNGESDAELRAACGGHADVHVLHGSGVQVEGQWFWGLGAAVPVTPFGSWSFDLSEDEARPLLADCPEGAVLVTHSPPRGHVDEADGRHLGSRAVLEVVERARPVLVVCGHVHASWERESRLGGSRIVNAGPRGVWAEV